MDGLNNNNKNNILYNIKSKYILKIIFNNLILEKELKIINYNKNLQEKLDKDINDYKNYLKIEIEIIPEEKKYSKFFNASKNNESLSCIFK